MADEDIWDSWEDFADSTDLDKHVDQHLRLTNGSNHFDDGGDDRGEDSSRLHNSSNDDSSNSGTQFRILPRPVVHEDDMNRTAYIPQVKILKRPGNETQSKEEKSKTKQKSQPARTLAEREAAYAEARKRIMGPVTGQSNSTTPNNAGGKSRSENKKTRAPKESNTIHVERQPKGPDKSNRGFTTPR